MWFFPLWSRPLRACPEVATPPERQPKMATRLVFRRHNHYNTASNRVRRVKTPGSKVVYLNVRKQASRQKCGGCGRLLPGIPACRPPQFRLLKKRERKVNRAYGGSRCHSCVREKVLRAFLVEEQKCVKQVLQVKERQKRDEVKTESKKGKKSSK